MSAIAVHSVVRVLVVLALVTGPCVACVPAPAPGDPPSATAPGSLAWGPCRGPGWPVTARCADLAVPLDHAAPSGPSITLRVSWVPATDRARRIGTLIANPGGPGAAGLRNHLFDAPGSAPLRAAVARYDLVGFDPRGVGESTPLRCGLNPDQVTAVRAPSPSPAGPGADARAAAEVSAACAARGGPLLAHMTTADVAADLDMLRAALGTERFSYYGSSYGTYLGVVYDRLFPGRFDRVVLDSLVDSQHGWYAQMRRTARSVELRFDDFSGWAVASAAGLGETPAEVRRRYLAVTAERQRAPLTPPGAVIDGAAVRRATYALVGRNRFAQLAELLRCAGAAAGQPCQAALGQALRRVSGAEGSGADGVAAFLAVTCTDSYWPRDPAEYARIAAGDAARHPVSAGGFAQIGPCATWPIPARPTVTAADRPEPPQILLLNNTRDRISELGGARSTRAALGGRARLITVEGWNHQIVGNEDRCADAAVADWLGNGRLPGTDRSCPAR